MRALLVKYLLGAVIVAEDIDYATAIAKNQGYRVKVVTLDGQVVNPGGSLTGGSVAKNSGLLSRSNDIKAIEADIEKLETKIADLDAQILKNASDYGKLHALTLEKEEAETVLMEKMDRWE